MDKPQTCAIRKGNTYSDEAPGAKCGKPVVTMRRSGTYRVPVCAEHAQGRALYLLGEQLYGCD